jgi:hypothetical protein
MPRFCLTLVSVLSVLIAANGLAQTPVEQSIGRLPSVVNSSPVPPSPAPNPAAVAAPVADAPPVNLPATGATSPESAATAAPAPANPPLRLDKTAAPPPVASLGDFQGYRYSTSSFDYIPGNQLGMFSIDWNHYQPAGINQGLDVGMGFHFLDGPVETDMPPRVFDFSLAYQIRHQFGPLRFDLSASVLAASDFEGSARKGILFPAHAVGFYSVRPELDLALGVDYLDRGDIKLLPVAGLIWMPRPELRLELVFPRPRAVFQLTSDYRLYLSGELGGGTWAIERPNFGDDLATYRELRASVGLEHVENANQRSALEVSYLFARRLEYTSGIGNMPLDDAVMIRLITRF